MSHTYKIPYDSSDEEVLAKSQKRESRRQKFSMSLQKNYGAKNTANPPQVWSLMPGEWVPESEIYPTAIFPWFPDPSSTASHFFGEDAKDDIFTASNGLFLPNSIRHLFEHGQIVIVPYGDEEHQQHQQQQQEEKALKPQEWKFLVPDREKLQKESLPLLRENDTVADLHERKLIFEPEHPFRPKAQYLYFHYVLAMINFAVSGTAKAEGGEEVKEVDGEAEVKRMIEKAEKLAGFNKVDWSALQEEINFRKIIIQGLDQGLLWARKSENGSYIVKKKGRLGYSRMTARPFIIVLRFLFGRADLKEIFQRISSEDRGLRILLNGWIDEIDGEN